MAAILPHPLTDLKNFFVRMFGHMPSTNPPSVSPLGPEYRLVHFYQPLLPTLAAILPRPLDRSKKFLRKNVRAHALYQPTKFQPARPSHLRVYRLVHFKRPLLIPQGSLRSPWIMILQHPASGKPVPCTKKRTAQMPERKVMGFIPDSVKSQ